MSATVVSGPAIHPLADLIPAMGEEAYDELRNDVAARGLHQPIVLFENMVLDGRHRLRACQETATPMRFEEYDGDEPAAHVLSLNLHRRHLSVSQRAMIATDFLPHLEHEARARMAAAGRSAAPGHPKLSPSADTLGSKRERTSSAYAGRVAGVAPETVQRAKRIAEAGAFIAAALIATVSP